MSNKLKIYACSGIGDAQTQEQFNYWTDNTNTLTNTQAVNTLLALINRNYIEVNYLRGMSAEQKIANLNDIDVYAVCLAAAQRFKDDNKALRHAGLVIGEMMSQGDFNYQSLNNSERDAHLDHLLDKAQDRFGDDKDPENVDLNFVAWFDETVVARNKVGLSEEKRQRVRKVLDETVSGIGASDWTKNKELSEFLLNGGTYFLYTYFTEAQLRKLPKIFRQKKDMQRRTYNYCKSLFVGIYGSEDEMKEVIRSGIVRDFGQTPEEVCADIVAGKRTISGIGMTPEMIAAIVIAVLAVVVSAIVEIIKAQKAAEGQKYAAADKELIEQSVPNEDDWSGLKIPGSSNLKTSAVLIALAAVGAFLFMRK